MVAIRKVCFALLAVLGVATASVSAQTDEFVSSTGAGSAAPQASFFFYEGEDCGFETGSLLAQYPQVTVDGTCNLATGTDAEGFDVSENIKMGNCEADGRYTLRRSQSDSLCGTTSAPDTQPSVVDGTSGLCQSNGAGYSWIVVCEEFTAAEPGAVSSSSGGAEPVSSSSGGAEQPAGDASSTGATGELKPVVVNMHMALEINTILSQPGGLAKFKTDLANAIADAIRVRRDRVQVVDVSAGSVVARVLILDESPAVAEASARELVAQTNDPASALLQTPIAAAIVVGSAATEGGGSADTYTGPTAVFELYGSTTDCTGPVTYQYTANVDGQCRIGNTNLNDFYIYYEAASCTGTGGTYNLTVFDDIACQNEPHLLTGTSGSCLTSTQGGQTVSYRVACSTRTASGSNSTSSSTGPNLSAATANTVSTMLVVFVALIGKFVVKLF
jgi:hypothetical protein